MAIRKSDRVRCWMTIPIFAWGICAFSQSFPADKNISLRCGIESLRKVLKTISDQSGIGFAFQDDLVNGRTVSCDSDSLPLDRALDSILSPAGISFKRMQDGLIVLFDAGTADRLIKGWVVDASSGNGLPNANILQEGTTLGTTSGMDGHFMLKTN
jgi:hypothetical protein